MISKTYYWEKKPKYVAKTRKVRRIEKHGTESELFIRIWNERPHNCETCGRYITEPKAHNFDHVIGKGRDQSKRYDPANIAIVCQKCHHEKTFGGVYK